MVKSSRATLHHLSYLIKKEPLYLARQMLPFLTREVQKKIAPHNGGTSFSLKFVWIMLTYRCNLRCEMCGLWGEEGIWKNYDKNQLSEELSSAQIASFLTQVAPYKPMVLLTGGEPMLFPEWDRIAYCAKTLGLRTAMSTNGTLLKEYAQEACHFLDVLEISLDGPAPIHDLVRKKEQTYARLTEGIQALAREKEKNHKHHPYINLSFTINNINFRILSDFVRFLEKAPFPFHQLIIRHLEFITEEKLKSHREFLSREFQRASTVFRGYLYPPDPELKKILPHQLKKLMETELYKQGRISFEPPFSLKEAEKFYTDLSYLPARYKRCYSPWLGVSLLPNGELWICPDYPVGNIKDAPFEKLWNNRKAKAFRQCLTKKGLMPACRTCASLYIY